jgi:serine/threonine protein kinase
MGREFWNEIETLQRIEHLNLVRFHGYLEFGGEQLIIVEYVPNGNLREHLDCKNAMVLSISLYALEVQRHVALYELYLT